MKLVFRLIASLSGIGFIASLVVHGYALHGTPLQEHFSYIWLLHFGIFIVFIPLVLAVNVGPSKTDPLAMFRGMPAWAVTSLVLLASYAFLNFFVSLSITQGATPEKRDGVLVLHNKGRVLREITVLEYRAAKAAQLRLASGHWLLFYAGPLSFFAFRRYKSEA